MKNTYERKPKGDKPVIAICYDFDKTLSPDDMQAQGFIQTVGYDVPEFWKETNQLAQDNDMDQNLAYMLMMIKQAHGKVIFNKETLLEYGAKVKLFEGVEEWFSRINRYGEDNNVIIEHYIISSGLKEMIEGTSIAGFFEKIYASSFYFDKQGVAQWPAQAVNYTNKTQFLFRIQKGVLDVNDFSVNDYFAPEDIRIPFRNMIYIGDSDTDIPCMKLVNANGGHSIGVYDGNNKDKTKVHKMLRESRIKYFTPANYENNSELDKLVKAIIERTSKNEMLESIYFDCKEESFAEEAPNIRMEEIMELSNSRSFATTHKVIKKLMNLNGWNEDEKNLLYEIGVNNPQVHYILNDIDVKTFYNTLLKNQKGLNKDAKKIKDILTQE